MDRLDNISEEESSWQACFCTYPISHNLQCEGKHGKEASVRKFHLQEHEYDQVVPS